MSAPNASVTTADLVETLRTCRNPFDEYKVVKAGDGIIDVPHIHADVSRKLERELEAVLERARSRGVLIKGVAGSGKSHLLARLFQGREKDVLFFQVEPLPGEATGWLKHILQCIVQDLQRPAFSDSDEPQLAILIKHVMVRAKKPFKILGRGTNMDVLNAAVERIMHQISVEIADPLVHDILHALKNIWVWGAPFGPNKEKRRHKIFLTVRWLKGVMIDEDELKLVGLSRNLGEDVQTGDQPYLTALRVMGMLTKSQAPIVLAFDQLDSMSDTTMNALGNQLLHLIGSDSAAPNYLIVTAGIQEQMERFARENIISQGASDVLFRTELELPALQPTDCERIVAARMQTVLPRSLHKGLPKASGDLFPFTSSSLGERLAGPVAPTPRRVVKIAGSIFDDVQRLIDEEWIRKWPRVKPISAEPAPRDIPTVVHIDDFLSAELQRRNAEGKTNGLPDPVDGDLLAQTLKSLIDLTGDGGAFVNVDLPSGKYEKPSSAFVALGIRTQPLCTAAVLVENRGHWKTVDATLKRLVDFARLFASPEKLFLVREYRAKKMDGWKQPNQRLAELAATKRFTRIDLQAEDVIALLSLDGVRIDQPDLIIPPRGTCGEYQVTRQDVAGFINRKDLLTRHPLFSTVAATLSAESGSAKKKMTLKPATVTKAATPPAQQMPPTRHITGFIFARLQVKKLYGYEACLTEWVNHQGRTTPTEADRHAFRTAVQELCNQMKIFFTEGAQALLKLNPKPPRT